MKMNDSKTNNYSDRGRESLVRQMASLCKSEQMSATRIPISGGSVPRAEARCGAHRDGGASFEHKIAIVATDDEPARTETAKRLAAALANRGWEFVSENRGIFHYKRLKQQVTLVL